ncbi:MAG: GTP-binding protein [Chloroflexota bacterium]|nr:GTP-binding protein [Chloroflexota bacterium]MDE2945783.1 GTP-binding protein [Chloroflexota bacterium]
MNLPVDWGTLWLGGFCPVGALGGLPVRGADYAAHPPLDDLLTLPRDTRLRAGVTHELAEQKWSEQLGGAMVVLARDAYRARRLLHQAAGIQPGERVGIPANASHDLAESIKHHKALPRFLDFDAHLRLATSCTRFTWTQVLRGLWRPTNAAWLDCADTLPTIPLPGAVERPAVTLYGLHLPDADDSPGALLAFSDKAFFAEVKALRQPADCPNAAQALAQCERLPEMAARQIANLAEVRRGLREAAGLATHEPNSLALATAVAVQIPLECDVATFYAYVEQENTPVRWLPQIQPLHYAALRADGAPDHRRTAANLDRALEIDPKFMEPEYPFEWSGIYDLKTGDYQWVMGEGPDPAMGAALLPLAHTGFAAQEATLMDAVLTFSEDEQALEAGDMMRLGKGQFNQLALNENGETVFNFAIQEPGYYMLFTEHHPDEFDARLCGEESVLEPLEDREYKPDHEHDEEVTSVGITLSGDLQLEKLNGWLSQLLREQGQDIFRMKGVLSVRGWDERFVFQGVHMLFDGRPDRPWGRELRQNKMIFIGRKLDRAVLENGFRECLAS